MGQFFGNVLFWLIILLAFFGVTYDEKHYFLSCTDKKGIELKVEDVSNVEEIILEKEE